MASSLEAEPAQAELGAPAGRPPRGMRVGEVVDAFGGDLRAGLDEREARRRLERDGPNVLPDRPPPSLFALLARQFANAMVLLLVAAVVSFVIGESLDGAIILAIVVVNAGFGAVQEGRAEQAARAVRALLEPRAVVVRQGRAREIEACGLVGGDVMVVGMGDRVAATGVWSRPRAWRSTSRC